MRAIIVDIDGTLCNLEHRLHHISNKPKNWQKFYESMHLDKPKEDVISIIRTLDAYYTVLFLTGRPEKYRAQTLNWLKNNVLNYVEDSELFMRQTNDSRQDNIIKKEIYEKQIAPKYEVTAIFEDRTRVVDMWRKLKLTCFQVDRWEEI